GAPSWSPAFNAGWYFRTALAHAGVRVDGPVRVGRGRGFTLATHYSAPLGCIVREMDTESDNFDAEMLFKGLGATLGRRGSWAAGATQARLLLAREGIPLAHVRIADGSGLSGLDRLTPAAVVTILQKI